MSSASTVIISLVCVILIIIVWASVVCQQCLAFGYCIFLLSVLNRAFRSSTSTQHKRDGCVSPSCLGRTIAAGAHGDAPYTRQESPRLGIEPRTSARQAEILTTILPQICWLWQFMLEIKLCRLWHFCSISYVSGLAAEPKFPRFWCRGVRGATRGPTGQGASFQACSCQPSSWLLGNVLMTMTRPWVYQQKAPRPGIEPGSSA